MLKKFVRNTFAQMGYTISKADQKERPDLMREDRDFQEIYQFCKPYTLTSEERMYSLYLALDYLIKNQIEGDIVECGVWRGGSSMLVAKYLTKHHIQDRNLWLYDTFTGMSEPTEDDTNFQGVPVMGKWKTRQQNSHNEWAYASLETVRENLYATGYPQDKIHFVEGKVEDTLPNQIPENIALLRLDTDWYESTYHELIHLYPILVNRGVLVIDDYGHFPGAKKAVDQYFSEQSVSMLLNRIDYTGRVGIKTEHIGS